jgi:hypothetical protein
MSKPVAITVAPQAETKQMTSQEIMLIQWEEWALSIEEHYHTVDLFNRNPGGQPMGHR